MQARDIYKQTIGERYPDYARSLNNLRALYKSMGDYVRSEREVFRVNQSLFERGQTDFLQLLQAQRTLIEADLGYLEAEEARWTSAAIISGLLQQERFP